MDSIIENFYFKQNKSNETVKSDELYKSNIIKLNNELNGLQKIDDDGDDDKKIEDEMNLKESNVQSQYNCKDNNITDNNKDNNNIKNNVTTDKNRILVITHSNFISEFVNVIKVRRKEEIHLKLATVNTSLYIIKICCKECKGDVYCKCLKKCDDNLEYEFKLFNDASHLIVSEEVDINIPENLGD